MKLSDVYIRNSLNRESKKIKPIKVTIFLAVVSLTVFVLFFSSIIGEIQSKVENTTGNYHSKLQVELDSEKVKTLENNVNIEKLGYHSKLGISKVKNSEYIFDINLGDENYFKIMEPVFLEGDYPHNSNEIIIPKISGTDLGLKLGDKLETDNKTYTISGFFDYKVRSWNNEVLAYTYEDSKSLKSKATLVVIWFKDIKRTYEITPDIVNGLGLEFNHEYKRGNIGFNDYYLSSRYVKAPEWHEENSVSTGSVQDVFRIGAIGMALIGILFIIIIKNIFSVWENQHIREYSLYLSVGARPRDLRNLILKRLFKISAIPLALGLVFGTVLNFILFTIINHFYVLSQGNLSTDKISKFSVNISPIIFLIIIIISILVLLISSLAPIFKISKLNPIDGMKLYRIESRKRKKQFKIRGNSFIDDLSKMNFKLDKGKTIISIISISISLLILSFVLSLSSSLDLDMKHNKADEFEYYNYKINYYNYQSMPEKLISELSANYEYDYINFRSYDLFVASENQDIFSKEFLENKNRVDILENPIPLTIYGLDDRNFKEISNNLGLDPDRFTNRECIIINQFPENLKLPYYELKYETIFNENLDKINLTTYWGNFDENNKIIELDILGSTSDKDILNIPTSTRSVMAFVPMKNFLNIIEDLGVEDDTFALEVLYLRLPSDEGLGEIKEISEKYISTKDVGFYDRKNAKIFENNSYMILFVTLFAASIFIAVVGLTNSSSATESMKELRKQEFVLLQIIGMDKKSLKKLILKELNRIMFIIVALSIIFLIVGAFLGKTAHSVFSISRIILNMKLYIWAIYLFVVYFILRKNYLKIVEDVDLLNNSRIM